MTQYVSGLFFSPDLQRVVLLYKIKGPEGVVNTWTGVGGRIEAGEGIRSAMSREFEEEAGVPIHPLRWFGVHTVRYRNGNICHFLAAKAVNNAEFELVRMMESEPISFVGVKQTLQTCAKYLFSVRESASPEDRHTLMEGLPNKQLAYLLPMAVEVLTVPVGFQNLGY